MQWVSYIKNNRRNKNACKEILKEFLIYKRDPCKYNPYNSRDLEMERIKNKLKNSSRKEISNSLNICFTANQYLQKLI